MIWLTPIPTWLLPVVFFGFWRLLSLAIVADVATGWANPPAFMFVLAGLVVLYWLRRIAR
jgi:hypothetical protein